MATLSRSRDWEDLYKNSKVEEMPWYRKKLDQDIAKELKERNISHGEVLDLGTGPGTQAFELMKLGFTVTGSDVSFSAIKEAKKLSKDIEFIIDDILNTKLKNKFDIILDRGCFHVFDPEFRKPYIKNIKKLLKTNGLIFLKCFSDREPETGNGPHRISESILKDLFNKEFHIEKIVHTEFRGKRKPNPKALFVVIRKK